MLANKTPTKIVEKTMRQEESEVIAAKEDNKVGHWCVEMGMHAITKRRGCVASNTLIKTTKRTEKTIMNLRSIIFLLEAVAQATKTAVQQIQRKMKNSGRNLRPRER